MRRTIEFDVGDVVTDTVREVGRYIREQRSAAEMSVRHLAQQAGVSNPYLSQIERGLRHPSATILKDIARALRISAETLYVKAGLLDETHESVTAAILREPTLNERQKQVLLEVYESLRASGEATTGRAARHAAEGPAAAAPAATNGAGKKAAGTRKAPGARKTTRAGKPAAPRQPAAAHRATAGRKAAAAAAPGRKSTRHTGTASTRRRGTRTAAPVAVTEGKESR